MNTIFPFIVALRRAVFGGYRVAFWLLLGVLTRLISVVLLPRYEAPDEVAHWRYVQYLVQHRALPVAQHALDSASADWEFHQPPLYYLLLTPSLLFGDGVGFYVARLFGTVCFVLSFWVFSKMVIRYRLSALEGNIALATFALLPTYIFVSAGINNDNLLILFCTVFISAALSKKPIKGNNLYMWMGLCLAAAICTKFSAVILMPVLLQSLWQIKTLANKRKVTKVLLLVLPALVSVTVLLYRNLSLYGHPLYPDYVHHPATSGRESVLSRLAEIVHYMIWSVFSVAGKWNQYRSMVWPLSYVGLLLLVLGISAIYQRCKPLWHPLLATIVFNVLLVVWFGWAHDQPQGRFLLPSLSFLSLASAFGSGQVLGNMRMRRDRAALFGALYAATFIAGWVLALVKVWA